jgi:REP element-mobilizing transposase RayT
MKFRTRGGARKGAGRKPVGARAGVEHRVRPVVKPRTPAHITLRVAKHVWNLRTRRCFSVIHSAFCKASAHGIARESFRLIHYSIQGNHLHLLVEADDRAALMRGAKGLSVRLARALNRVMGLRGQVFADRYHVQLLTGPARGATRGSPCAGLAGSVLLGPLLRRLARRRGPHRPGRLHRAPEELAAHDRLAKARPPRPRRGAGRPPELSR